MPRHQTPASRLRSARMAMTVTGLAAFVGLGLLLSACAPLAPSTQAQAGQALPVIRTPTGSTTPTPGPLRFTVGAWPSNYTPAAGSSVTIYVSVRDAGAPVAGADAYAQAYYPGSRSAGAGPVKTNQQGYAALVMRVGAAVSPSGKTQRTVQVTVTVSYQGSTYHTTTNFTPL